MHTPALSHTPARFAAEQHLADSLTPTTAVRRSNSARAGNNGRQSSDLMTYDVRSTHPRSRCQSISRSLRCTAESHSRLPSFSSPRPFGGQTLVSDDPRPLLMATSPSSFVVLATFQCSPPSLLDSDTLNNAITIIARVYRMAHMFSDYVLHTARTIFKILSSCRVNFNEAAWYEKGHTSLEVSLGNPA